MLNVIRTLGTVTLLMYALVSFPQPLVEHHTAQVGAHKFDRTRHFPLANGNSDVTSIVPARYTPAFLLTPGLPGEYDTIQDCCSLGRRFVVA